MTTFDWPSRLQFCDPFMNIDLNLTPQTQKYYTLLLEPIATFLFTFGLQLQRTAKASSAFHLWMEEDIRAWTANYAKDDSIKRGRLRTAIQSWRALKAPNTFVNEIPSNLQHDADSAWRARLLLTSLETYRDGSPLEIFDRPPEGGSYTALNSGIALFYIASTMFFVGELSSALIRQALARGFLEPRVVQKSP